MKNMRNLGWFFFPVFKLFGLFYSYISFFSCIHEILEWSHLCWNLSHPLPFDFSFQGSTLDFAYFLSLLHVQKGTFSVLLQSWPILYKFLKPRKLLPNGFVVPWTVQSLLRGNAWWELIIRALLYRPFFFPIFWASVWGWSQDSICLMCFLGGRSEQVNKHCCVDWLILFPSSVIRSKN